VEVIAASATVEDGPTSITTASASDVVNASRDGVILFMLLVENGAAEGCGGSMLSSSSSCLATGSCVLLSIVSFCWVCLLVSKEGEGMHGGM